MSNDKLVSERRGFLKTILMASTVGFTGGSTGSFLLGGTPAHADAPSDGAYTPQYFNDAEWRRVNAAVDRLIPPSEDGPGGLELQVPQFIYRCAGR